MSRSYKVLKQSEVETLFAIGEVIIGASREELGDDFISEIDGFVGNLDDYLIADIHKLLFLFNSRLLSLITFSGMTKFTKKSLEAKEKYYQKFVSSKIPLFRTLATTVRAICGWSYYSNENVWDELKIPGKTLGREEETPTLKNIKYYQGVRYE